MPSDLQKLSSRVHRWLGVVVSSLVGLRLAVDLYSGPSIGLGICIACGIAGAFGLSSLWLGQRFWSVFAWLVLSS